jgi:hypothetical protein
MDEVEETTWGRYTQESREKMDTDTRGEWKLKKGKLYRKMNQLGRNKKKMKMMMAIIIIFHNL